jgi:hypothetical protein
MSDFQPIAFEGSGDGVLCTHCGDAACWPDDDGTFSETICANCGIEGHVDGLECGSPAFIALEHAKCERDDCPECTP